MERADDGALAMALLAVHDPRAAVAAEVVEGADHAVAPAHDDRALAQKIEGEPVAGSGDVGLVSHDLPVGEEDPIAFKAEQGGRMICPGRQAASIPVARDRQAPARQFVHGDISSSRKTHSWKR